MKHRPFNSLHRFFGPAVLLASAMGMAVPALAADVLHVPYEIDGNAVTTGANGDDADEIFAGTSSGAARSAKRDKVGDSTDDNYTGGGSKDERDVSGSGSNFWQHTMTSPPDKIDLEHAWASAYKTPRAGDTTKNDIIATFGATRFSNDGDAAVGFWFFKSQVSEGPNGKFIGVHSTGDVLITSDFRQGGSASVINVFKWVGGSKPLELLATSDPSSPKYAGGFVDPTTKAFCLGSTSNAIACAVANAAPVPVPSSMKPFVFKVSGSAVAVDDFPQGSFFEGAVNLTGLLGADAGCFSSFLAMSRTSASTTAQLKDFSLDSFPLCSVKVTKSCPTGTGTIEGGNKLRFPFTVTIENDGAGDLNSVELAENITLGGNSGVTCTIDGAPATTGTFVPVVNVLKGGESIPVSVVCDTVSVGGQPANSALGNIVSVRAKSSAGASSFDITKSYTTTEEDKCPIPTSTVLTVDKHCDATKKVKIENVNGILKPKVCVVIDAKNEGTENLIGVSVSDDKAGPVTSGQTLLPGELKSFPVCYYATATDGGLENPCQITFSDMATVSGKGAITGQTQTVTDTATCKLCDNCSP